MKTAIQIQSEVGRLMRLCTKGDLLPEDLRVLVACHKEYLAVTHMAHLEATIQILEADILQLRQQLAGHDVQTV